MPSPPPPPPGHKELAQSLSSLAQLHKDGSLTDDEFAQAKATALQAAAAAAAAATAVATHQKTAAERAAAERQKAATWAAQKARAASRSWKTQGGSLLGLPSAAIAVVAVARGGSSFSEMARIWTVASSLSQGSIFWACAALVVYVVVGSFICEILPTAESTLYKAVGAGDGQAVATLLQQGADPDHGERTAIPLVGRFLIDNTPLIRCGEEGQISG